jgi:hypothetical protein
MKNIREGHIVKGGIRCKDIAYSCRKGRIAKENI